MPKSPMRLGYQILRRFWNHRQIEPAGTQVISSLFG